MLQHISFNISLPQKTSKTVWDTHCRYMPAPRELPCCWKKERAMSTRKVRFTCLTFLFAMMWLCHKKCFCYHCFTFFTLIFQFCRNKRWSLWTIEMETAGFKCWDILGSNISNKTACFHPRLCSVLFGQQQEDNPHCKHRYCDTQLQYF